MPNVRTPYGDLPYSVKSLIAEVTGPVRAVEQIDAGKNNHLAVRLGAVNGVFFVKGLPADHRWVFTQQREADIAPHLGDIAATLATHVVAGGWDLLVFEALSGHHADYSPGSADLPLVVNLLHDLAATECPAIDLRLAEVRWAEYVDRPGGADEFAGPALLHTDWNETNVLINNRARLVDWGWATRGAAWLDPALWVIWLIATGHTPAEAEQWAAKVTSWTTAPPDALRRFAAANARFWSSVAETAQDTWTLRLVGASATWAEYRHHVKP